MIAMIAALVTDDYNKFKLHIAVFGTEIKNYGYYQ